MGIDISTGEFSGDYRVEAIMDNGTSFIVAETSTLNSGRSFAKSIVSDQGYIETNKHGKYTIYPIHRIKKIEVYLRKEK